MRNHKIQRKAFAALFAATIFFSCTICTSAETDIENTIACEDIRYALSRNDSANPWNSTFSGNYKWEFKPVINGEIFEGDEITIIKGQYVDLSMAIVGYDQMGEIAVCYTDRTIGTYTDFYQTFYGESATYGSHNGPNVYVNDDSCVSNEYQTIYGKEIGSDDIYYIWNLDADLKHKIAIRSNSSTNITNRATIDILSTFVPMYNENNQDYYKQKRDVFLESNPDIKIHDCHTWQSYTIWVNDECNWTSVAKTFKVNVIEQSVPTAVINGKKIHFDENNKLFLKNGYVLDLSLINFDDDPNAIIKFLINGNEYDGNSIEINPDTKITVETVTTTGNKVTYTIECDEETKDNDVKAVVPHFEVDSTTINILKGEGIGILPNLVFPDGTLGGYHDNFNVTYTSDNENVLSLKDNNYFACYSNRYTPFDLSALPAKVTVTAKITNKFSSGSGANLMQQLEQMTNSSGDSLSFDNSITATLTVYISMNGDISGIEKRQEDIENAVITPVSITKKVSQTGNLIDTVAVNAVDKDGKTLDSTLKLVDKNGNDYFGSIVKLQEGTNNVEIYDKSGDVVIQVYIGEKLIGECPVKLSITASNYIDYGNTVPEDNNQKEPTTTQAPQNDKVPTQTTVATQDNSVAVKTDKFVNGSGEVEYKVSYKLSDKNISLDIGGEKAVKVKITEKGTAPFGKDPNYLSWTSTNNTVAYVVGDGLSATIKAFGSGSCVISATALDGTVVSCNVTVGGSSTTTTVTTKQPTQTITETTNEVQNDLMDNYNEFDWDKLKDMLNR